MFTVLSPYILLLTLFPCVLGYGGGAPPTKCGGSGNMMPDHGLPVQTTPFPYSLTISTSQTTYSPGATLLLTISGAQFKGFLIHSIDASGGIVGRFMVSQSCSQVLICSGGGSGLTHKSKTIKDTCGFEWQAPNINSGDITFFLTVVQDYSTYWVNQDALVLSFSPTEAPPVTNPPLAQTTFVSTTTPASASLTPTTRPAQVTTNSDPNHLPPVSQTNVHTPANSVADVLENVSKYPALLDTKSDVVNDSLTNIPPTSNDVSTGGGFHSDTLGLISNVPDVSDPNLYTGDVNSLPNTDIKMYSTSNNASDHIMDPYNQQTSMDNNYGMHMDGFGQASMAAAEGFGTSVNSHQDIYNQPAGDVYGQSLHMDPFSDASMTNKQTVNDTVHKSEPVTNQLDGFGNYHSPTNEVAGHYPTEAPIDGFGGHQNAGFTDGFGQQPHFGVEVPAHNFETGLNGLSNDPFSNSNAQQPPTNLETTTQIISKTGPDGLVHDPYSNLQSLGLTLDHNVGGFSTHTAEANINGVGQPSNTVTDGFGQSRPTDGYGNRHDSFTNTPIDGFGHVSQPSNTETQNTSLTPLIEGFGQMYPLDHNSVQTSSIKQQVPLTHDSTNSYSIDRNNKETTTTTQIPLEQAFQMSNNQLVSNDVVDNLTSIPNNVTELNTHFQGFEDPFKSAIEPYGVNSQAPIVNSTVTDLNAGNAPQDGFSNSVSSVTDAFQTFPADQSSPLEYTADKRNPQPDVAADNQSSSVLPHDGFGYQNEGFGHLPIDSNLYGQPYSEGLGLEQHPAGPNDAFGSPAAGNDLRHSSIGLPNQINPNEGFGQPAVGATEGFGVNEGFGQAPYHNEGIVQHGLLPNEGFGQNQNGIAEGFGRHSFSKPNEGFEQSLSGFNDVVGQPFSEINTQPSSGLSKSPTVQNEGFGQHTQTATQELGSNTYGANEGFGKQPLGHDPVQLQPLHSEVFPQNPTSTLDGFGQHTSSFSDGFGKQSLLPNEKLGGSTSVANQPIDHTVAQNEGFGQHPSSPNDGFGKTAVGSTEGFGNPSLELPGDLGNHPTDSPQGFEQNIGGSHPLPSSPIEKQHPSSSNNFVTHPITPGLTPLPNDQHTVFPDHSTTGGFGGQPSGPSDGFGQYSSNSLDGFGQHTDRSNDGVGLHTISPNDVFGPPSANHGSGFDENSKSPVDGFGHVGSVLDNFGQHAYVPVRGQEQTTAATSTTTDFGIELSTTLKPDSSAQTNYIHNITNDKVSSFTPFLPTALLRARSNKAFLTNFTYPVVKERPSPSSRDHDSSTVAPIHTLFQRMNNHGPVDGFVGPQSQVHSIQSSGTENDMLRPPMGIGQGNLLMHKFLQGLSKNPDFLNGTRANIIQLKPDVLSPHRSVDTSGQRQTTVVPLNDILTNISDALSTLMTLKDSVFNKTDPADPRQPPVDGIQVHERMPEPEAAPEHSVYEKHLNLPTNVPQIVTHIVSTAKPQSGLMHKWRQEIMGMIKAMSNDSSGAAVRTANSTATKADGKPVEDPHKKHGQMTGDQDKMNEMTEPGLSAQVQGGSIIYDPECGFSKGCFVDCKGQECNYMITWRDVGVAIQFEVYGKPDPSHTDFWQAVGFSDDSRMGDDSVTECVYTNGEVKPFNSFNQGYSNRRLRPSQLGLANFYGQYTNGVLYCTFTRQKSNIGQPEMFDLERDWNIMFAQGRAEQLPAFHISMHSISDLPPVSASSVDFQSMSVIGSAAKFPLVKAHGCLMIFAWVMFTGIGIVAARHYKSVWHDKTLFKLKIWFQIHRMCMIAALALNLLAFVLIFIEVGGYSEIPDIPGKGYLRSHPVLGIVVTCLCLANPIMALFRPGPDHKKRIVFNWAHWGVGMSAYILSAICICFGFQLGKSSTPDYAVYIMIVYVLYVIVFDVVFEVMDCMHKKEKAAKVEGLEMTTRNGTDNGNVPNGNNYHSKENVKKSDKVKTMLMAIHIAFTGAFALVLSLVVALN